MSLSEAGVHVSNCSFSLGFKYESGLKAPFKYFDVNRSVATFERS